MEFVYDFLNVSMGLVRTNFMETLGADNVVGEVLVIGDNDLKEISSNRHDGFINSVNMVERSFSRRILTADTAAATSPSSQ